jgi:hypothetical protein
MDCLWNEYLTRKNEVLREKNVHNASLRWTAVGFN